MAEQQQQQQQGQQVGKDIKGLLPEKRPSTSLVVAVISLFPIVGTLLTLAGLTLTGTIIGLCLTTPVFVIFSPVLVPAAITIGLGIMGFLTSGALGLSAVGSLYALSRIRAIAKNQDPPQKTIQQGQPQPHNPITQNQPLDQMKIHHQPQHQRIQHQPQPLIQRYLGNTIKSLLPQKRPSAKQIVAVSTLVPVGGTLLTLSGLTLAATTIGVCLATPVFVIFSPVLVPATITLGSAVMGFLSSGAFGLTAMSSLSWVVNYVRGAHVPEQLDQVRRHMQDATGQMGQEVGQRIKSLGQLIQQRAQEGGWT